MMKRQFNFMLDNDQEVEVWAETSKTAFDIEVNNIELWDRETDNNIEYTDISQEDQDLIYDQLCEIERQKVDDWEYKRSYKYIEEIE